jgi:hypothetical protein
MKKLALLSFAALVLSGCSDKNNYEAAVLADVKLEQSQSQKDYKVDPEKMASCIVEASSANMHGLFAFDPDRLTAYRNYTKMLTLPNSADPKKTMEELRNDFGTPQELIAARSNYIESQMACLESFVESADIEVDKK